MALKHPLEHIADVLEQVPPVGHLHGFRRPIADALRCGDLAMLIEAVTAPLTPARFVRNS